MPAFPSYSSLTAAALHELLALGADDGLSWPDGQFATRHTIYPDVLIIDPGYADQREYKIWLESNTVKGICALPDEAEAGGQSYYLLDEEDEALLSAALQRMAASLLPACRPGYSELLAFLGHCIGEEQAARLFDARIGSFPADVRLRWALLADVLDEAGQLTSFEWQAWHDEGVALLNTLPIVAARDIHIPEPDGRARRAVLDADDPRAAMFDYFRLYLDEAELMLVALGSELADFQTFVVLPLDDYRAARALAQCSSLGLAAQW
ncbi:DUF6630 family protein [Chitinilyticum litopenaei]|uniref:DUF6630 family protein n=1 Tax=Chitinilyticum litopenaei TaxID=1121276 RepID=UPI0003FFD7BD|nr:hypothetical protein [Chitinilyticum litopenaei]